MKVPAWLDRLLRRRLRRLHHTHLPKPTITSPTQKALIKRISEEDQRRLERLSDELHNKLRLPIKLQ